MFGYKHAHNVIRMKNHVLYVLCGLPCWFSLKYFPVWCDKYLGNFLFRRKLEIRILRCFLFKQNNAILFSLFLRERPFILKLHMYSNILMRFYDNFIHMPFNSILFLHVFMQYKFNFLLRHFSLSSENHETYHLIN